MTDGNLPSGPQGIIVFHQQGLSPRVALETTSKETIVSMVEAGLGISIVPLLPSGVVTDKRRVDVRALAGRIRPIHSGILMRSARETLGSRGPSARLCAPALSA